jgi:hypothetical protein
VPLGLLTWEWLWTAFSTLPFPALTKPAKVGFAIALALWMGPAVVAYV